MLTKHVTKLPVHRGEMGCIDGCILATQRWDVHCETDGTVLLAVCFKSTRDEAPGASWEKWTALIYSGDAALNMHILKQTAWRCVPCVSKLFVTKLPSLRGEMGCMVCSRRSQTPNTKLLEGFYWSQIRQHIRRHKHIGPKRWHHKENDEHDEDVEHGEPVEHGDARRDQTWRH